MAEFSSRDFVAKYQPQVDRMVAEIEGQIVIASRKAAQAYTRTPARASRLMWRILERAWFPRLRVH